MADRAELAAENLALRQQLAILKQRSKRLRLRKRDRIFRAWLSRFWSKWRSALVIAYQSPWQSPNVERLIGSIRRECLNRVIVINERHLRHILSSNFVYYHESRNHLSVNRNSPAKRKVEPPDRGTVIAIPQVGGPHYRYCRAA